MFNRIVLGILAIFQRCIVAYAAIAIFLFFVVDFDTVKVSRINYMKGQFGNYPQEFQAQKAKFSPQMIRVALCYYKRLVKWFSDPSLAYGGKGTCHYYLKEYPQAIAAYQKALSLETRLYFFSWDLGMTFFSVGDYPNAVKYLTQSLDLFPDTMRYYRKLGRDLSKDNDKTKLVPLYVLYKTMDEDKQTALHVVAQSFFKLQEYKGMKTWSLLALENLPQNALFNYDVGLANFMLGDYKDAGHFFSKAIELNPNSIQAYRYRAFCMEKLGYALQAKTDQQQVLRLQEQGLKEEEPVKLHFNEELLRIRYLLSEQRRQTGGRK